MQIPSRIMSRAQTQHQVNTDLVLMRAFLLSRVLTCPFNDDLLCQAAQRQRPRGARRAAMHPQVMTVFDRGTALICRG